MVRSKQPIMAFFRLLFTPGKQQATRNHLVGMGSIFDLSGHYFEEDEESVKDEQADCLAMYSDWDAVGNDLKGAFRFHLSEIRDFNAHESAKRRLSGNC